MRIMGLDLGDKRIGVALSDPFGWTAQGHSVIIRTGNLGGELEKLKAIVREYSVELIVVGMPKNMNGTVGPRGKSAEAYAGMLGNKLGLPVETWDERLSTVFAEKTLIMADVSRAARKKVIDKVAAAVILQGYLDARCGKA